MSALLQQWLTAQDVGLPVTFGAEDFGKAFCSGYLFGELLAKLQCISASDFNSLFTNSSNPENHQDNFIVLERILRETLGIKITPGRARDIMMGKPDSAAQLVSLIREAAAEREGTLAHANGLKLKPSQKGVHLPELPPKRINPRAKNASYNKEKTITSHHLSVGIKGDTAGMRSNEDDHQSFRYALTEKLKEFISDKDERPNKKSSKLHSVDDCDGKSKTKGVGDIVPPTVFDLADMIRERDKRSKRKHDREVDFMLYVTWTLRLIRHQLC
jgi:hypothetical protein